jgi:5-methyltetrahydropteroyltriglutamate--homocysteine methyltransferase
MSRRSYVTYVAERLEGFSGASPPLEPTDLAAHPDWAERVLPQPARRELAVPMCTSPLRYRGRPALYRDLANLRHALGSRESAGTFMTAASPGVVSLFFTNVYYRSHEQYLEAIADAMREEYEEIVGAGFTLQLDAPDLAMGRHMRFADPDLPSFLARVELHVAALDRAVARIPPERMRMHVCWGNYEGPHDHDVALRDILPILWRARPAALSFAAANPRHAHEWAHVEALGVPASKILMPGVIDSTTNYVEHPELVAQRIQRFVRSVGPERVIASTDCGFGTFAGIATVAPSVAWVKLAALVAGARLAEALL